jgi:hypothetical protein
MPTRPVVTAERRFLGRLPTPALRGCKNFAGVECGTYRWFADLQPEALDAGWAEDNNALTDLGADVAAAVDDGAGTWAVSPGPRTLSSPSMLSLKRPLSAWMASDSPW